MSIDATGLKGALGTGELTNQDALFDYLTTHLGTAATSSDTGIQVRFGSGTTSSAVDTVVTDLTHVSAVLLNMDDTPTYLAGRLTGFVGDQAGTPAAGSFQVKGWATSSLGVIGAASSFGKTYQYLAIGT